MNYDNKNEFDSDFHFEDIDAFFDKSVDTLMKEDKKIDFVSYAKEDENFVVNNKKIETLDIEENENIDVLDLNELEQPEILELEPNEIEKKEELINNTEVLDFSTSDDLVFDEKPNIQEELLNFDDNDEETFEESNNEVINNYDFEMINIDENEKTNNVEILNFDANDDISKNENIKAEQTNNHDSTTNEKIDETGSVTDDKKANDSIGLSNINEEKKVSKKKNTKNEKLILEIILSLLISGLIFVAYKIIKWNSDNKATASQMDNISEIVEITDVTDNENVIIIDDINREEDSKYNDNDYYKYITEPLINVDFTNLIEKNNDTIGWIQVNGTNINYPVVQSKNNDYYLTHSFDKKYNEAGWIFADYRNNLTNDRNLIIYGHARLNQTMFGTLKNILKESWYKNSDNYVIKLSTPKINSTWQVFSTYTIEPEDYYITTEFESDAVFYEFVKKLKSRSFYNYNVELKPTDKIITLSTCYSNNKRIVLHAKLIKYEDRV